MPNHVRSDVTITGPQATLKKIVELMRGETAFDFHKLLPMPDELMAIQTGMITIDGQQYKRWHQVGGKSIGIGLAETRDLVRKYGAPDWYEWATEHWGTKWNAYSVSEPQLNAKSLRYSFDTAWGSPTPVLQALANRFGVSIYVEVSGEVDEEYKYNLTPDTPKH